MNSKIMIKVQKAHAFSPDLFSVLGQSLGKGPYGSPGDNRVEGVVSLKEFYDIRSAFFNTFFGLDNFFSSCCIFCFNSAWVAGMISLLIDIADSL